MTKAIAIALTGILLAGACRIGADTMADEGVPDSADSAFHEAACADYEPSTDPWRMSNLYDCDTRTIYVSYHLWTGMPWDGSKDGSCMHAADTEFAVNGTSLTRIEGPIEWHNPVADVTESVWIRTKVDGSKTQYFTCHDNGIGRVYDRRVNRQDRHWATGRCKFPAGDGWRFGERRSCDATSIEITDIGISESGHLTHLTFKWWSGSTLDHIYRYEPDYGMANSWAVD